MLTLDATIEIPAPAMLLEEGVEGCQQLGHRGYSMT